jgi:hypothetical protein
MLQGFHLVCSAYGFWLPNEERGSGSDFVRSEALTKFGPANPVTHRRSVARKPFDPIIREMARASLKYEPVRFNVAQIQSIARGFEKELSQYCAAVVFACAIMRDHFHLVTGPCRYDVRRFAGRLKGAATKQLLASGLHPFQRIVLPDGSHPSPWSVKPWVVYCYSVEDMLRDIPYVERNPVKAGLGQQNWSFVAPYLAPTTPGAAHRR